VDTITCKFAVLVLIKKRFLPYFKKWEICSIYEK
jgi:hypothetical protein